MIYGFSSQVGVWLLAIGFVLIGFGFVWVTGSFNTQLSILELILNAPLFGVMQGTHALGGILGAILVGVVADYGLPVWKLELMNASIFMVGMLLPFAYLLPTDLEKLLESLRKQLKDDARRVPVRGSESNEE
jgi:MFS family permease